MRRSYAYSFDGEAYRGREESRRQCLAMARMEALLTGRLSKPLYIGTCEEPPVFNLLPDADTVIEHMQSQAYDQAGEFTESWLDSVAPHHQTLLTSMIQTAVLQWMTIAKELPNWFNITDATQEEPRFPAYDRDTLLGEGLTPDQVDSVVIAWGLHQEKLTQEGKEAAA